MKDLHWSVGRTLDRSVGRRLIDSWMHVDRHTTVPCSDIEAWSAVLAGS